MLLVFEGLQVRAVKGEGLNPSVSAVGHGQDRRLSPGVNPKPVGSLEFSVALSWFADLGEKFSVQGVAQYVAGAVTIADVKVTIGRERNIGRYEVNRPRALVGIFPRIAMDPDFFPGKRGLHHAAAIDVAMVQELFLSLAPQLQSMCPSTKTLPKGTNEPALLVKNNNCFAAHA